MVQPQSGMELISSLGETRLLLSYTALKIKFEFPSTVQYPNLPVRLDFTSIIFPSMGETFCTGLEFLLAMRLNCKIKILGGVYIPFQGKLDKPKKVSRSHKSSVVIPVIEPRLMDLMTHYKNNLFSLMPKTDRDLGNTDGENYHFLKNQLSKQSTVTTKDNGKETEFYSVVQEVLTERLKYPKGSYMNLLYKFIANAGIGQMARGLNQKQRYDSHTNSTRTQSPGALISPLYAGWITSFIRSTLSEIMNKNDSSLILSCTTDGFISNKMDLDRYNPANNDLFSSLYYKTRAKLTGSGALLETKYIEPKGVIS